MSATAIQTLLFDKNAPETKGQTIPEPFGDEERVNSRTYNLVERRGNAAIYEGPITPEKPELQMYEVIVIRTAQPKKFPSGTELPFREVYPSSEDWGTYGFTFTSRSHSRTVKSRALKDGVAIKAACARNGSLKNFT